MKTVTRKQHNTQYETGREDWGRLRVGKGVTLSSQGFAEAITKPDISSGRMALWLDIPARQIPQDLCGKIRRFLPPLRSFPLRSVHKKVCHSSNYP
ncbi:hypothetical protein IDJ81_02400 [Tsuneonella flava]|uniref:Uncharacterized protein n=1 Tax=Tsuneonella flava TaxID=2055955 RepID=A0ABX7K9W5_9SPHN|nr:hypothetical protein [Tsuneonella flava]QSB45036.1 hypothetical protein IDJ81_02400 [Tsuneonella flava]